MTTIRISPETLTALRIRKAQFEDRSYDETIKHLLDGGHQQGQDGRR